MSDVQGDGQAFMPTVVTVPGTPAEPDPDQEESDGMVS